MKLCQLVVIIVISVCTLGLIPARATTYRAEEIVTLTAGGSGSISTVESYPDQQTGYAIVTINSGSAPYATAVIRYSPNGIVASEVGVPTSPPTKSARLFAEYRTNVPSGAGAVYVNTGIAIVNTGTAIANISLVLRDLQGSTDSNHISTDSNRRRL